MKAELAFTRLHCVLFSKMALSEATELLFVYAFVDALSGFPTGAAVPVAPSVTSVTAEDPSEQLRGSHADAALLSRMYSCRHLHEEKLSYCEQMQKFAFVDVDLPAWR